MLKTTIAQCSLCKMHRLVQKVDNEWICYNCKQKFHIKATKTRKGLT